MTAKRLLFAAAIALSILPVAAPAASAADIFTLSSTTFQDGKFMPKNVANNAANSHNNPNCVGDNVSPQFSWTNVPEGAKSFVFFIPIPRAAPAPAVFIGSPTAFQPR